MFFFKSKKKAPLHTTLKCKVSSINFTENKLIITIFTNGQKDFNDSTTNLTIKNMNDAEEKYHFSITHTRGTAIHSEIDLSEIPFINKEGKWSIYCTINHKEYRLSPTKSLVMNIADTQKFVHGVLLTEPYITIKENISFRTVKNPNKPVKKKMASHVTNLQHADGVFRITGTVDGTIHDRLDAILSIQKRNTSLSYQFPLQWDSERSWHATIDFNCNDFSNGTWDYYIENKDKEKIRIKLDDQNVWNNNTSLYKNDNQVKKVSFYKTKNESLSTKHSSATIPISTITGTLVEPSQVKLTGVIENYSIFNEFDDIKFVIKERKSESNYEETANIYSDEETAGKFIFETIVDFDQLNPEDKTKKVKWDSYLHLKNHRIEYLIRMKIDDANTLQYDTRIQYEKLQQMYFYTTVNNYLSIALSKPSIQRNLYSCSFSDGKLIVKGSASFDYIQSTDNESIERAIIIRKRNTQEERTVPLNSLQLNKSEDSYFNVEIPITDIVSMQELLEEVYDFYICLTYKSYTSERKLGFNDYEYLVDGVLDRETYKISKDFFLCYLLLTPGGNIKLNSYRYPKEKIAYLMDGQNKDRLKYYDKDVWLVGERPDTAQDTGYHFFKYCRENYPNKEVYYVLEKDSPDMRNLQSLGNVLIHGSLEHLKMTAIAKKFIGSHDLEYILPSRAMDWPSYHEGQRIFLQHGILGRKNVGYHKSNYNYPFNMFCVSSSAEYGLVTDTMGYAPNEVVITGLSRYDGLMYNRLEEKSISIIPTWRDWIKTEAEFLESTYYHSYKNLLTDDSLLNELKSTTTKLQFFPHYRMQQYVEHFKRLESEYVEVIELGEVNIQDILKRNKLLITDYSSLSFDFNYMKKPVIYYHFDFNRFFKDGILRPFNEVFIGEICTTHDEVVASITNYVRNDFQEKQAIENQTDDYFTHVDQNNNKRIFEAISNLS